MGLLHAEPFPAREHGRRGAAAVSRPPATSAAAAPVRVKLSTSAVATGSAADPHAVAAAATALLVGGITSLRRQCAGRRGRVVRRARDGIPATMIARMKQKPPKEVLPYVEAPSSAPQWPTVLAPRKKQPDLATVMEGEEPGRLFTLPNFQGKEAQTMRQLMQTYFRMQDVPRIIRMGMSDPPGDGRGWAAVSLCKLLKFKEAAQLAAGPDGQTPCGYCTLRYVTNQLAKVGALEGAMHLARLQSKCGRTVHRTANSRVVESIIEASALYLQATAEHRSKLLVAHGAQVAMEMEKVMDYINDVLAITPNQRYLALTQPFNQLIRWLGRARLIPQAMRACEIMNELGVPRDEMTIHFLSRGAAQQYACIKKAKRPTQFPPDWPGRRPEVVFIGRTNSGKSAMINALLSSKEGVAPAKKIRAWTRTMGFYEINRERGGLPQFQIVDTPGLGYAGIPQAAKITKDWPDLIYSYLRRREALKHVFHFIDVRNTKLLPADKQLIHLLAKAQRRDVRYTIVITKIDVVKRSMCNSTAARIREELAPYCDVDIMFASAQTLRGVDHLWSKIWQSVIDTPTGRRHRDMGMKELAELNRRMRVPDDVDTLSEMLGVPRKEPPRPKAPGAAGFGREEEWYEDAYVEPELPAEMRATGGGDQYFNDNWNEDELAEEELLDYDAALDEEEDDFEEEDGFEDDELTVAGSSPSTRASAASEGAEEIGDDPDSDLERRWAATNQA